MTETPAQTPSVDPKKVVVSGVKPVKVMPWIYTIVFFSSMASSLLTTISVWLSEPDTAHGLAVFVFGLTSTVLLFYIYTDLDRLEEGDNYEGSTWIGTRFEVIVRVLLIVSLLFGAGKLLVVFYPAGALLHRIGIPIPSVDETHVKMLAFEVGTFSALMLVFIWNLMCLLRLPNSVGLNPIKWDFQSKTYHVVPAPTRIAGFCLTGLFGALFWFSVLLFGPSSLSFAPYFVVLFTLLLFGSLMLRDGSSADGKGQ